MKKMEKQTSLRHLSSVERLALIAREAELSGEEIAHLANRHPNAELAEHWIENPIGYYSLPLGIADHFVIDGRARRIPMAVEETSIIAAVSAAAKWVNQHGTLSTRTDGNLAVGQIHFPHVRDSERASEIIHVHSKELIALANLCVPGLVRRGGGFKEIEVRNLSPSLIVHLYADTCDAMGANLINQACESVAPTIEAWLNEKSGLKILSNLTDRKRVEATITLTGIDPELAKRIEESSLAAERDPYRAATHNKGIMNGIDAVLIATGNDWRAAEAGAHAYAARGGSYGPLSIWRSLRPGELIGTLSIPLSIGVVGGVTRTHPAASACLKIIKAESAAELARIVAAVGLVQNLAALRALSSEGIVRGHMRLHAGNLALGTDANDEERPLLIAHLRERLDQKNGISLQDAKGILVTMRAGDDSPVNGIKIAGTH